MQFLYSSAIAAAVGIALISNIPPPDQVFTRYPRAGRASLPEGGAVDVPYHNYRSDAVIVYGWAEPDAVAAKLQNQAFSPVVNEANGKSLVSFWVVDYKNTSVGPYKELVVVYLVSTTPGTTINCATAHCANAVNVKPGA